MITYKEGNILDANSEALVNTVNTVGVMGKGIALQFKNEFPQNYKAYKDAVKHKKIITGKVQIVEVNRIDGVKYVVNFPTKEHWRYPSKIQWIQDGLSDLVAKLKEFNIKSIAIPPLGCGNGGLDWNVIKPLIESYFENIDINLTLYEPSELIKEILKKEDKSSAAKLTQPRAMLLTLLYQYRTLGEFASEFAAEKLSYFLQRFGENQLRLNFKKAQYGPYSGQVRHVLYALNGYYLKGYEQKEAKPFETLELVTSKKAEVKDYIENSLSTDAKDRLENVKKLIQGFESPYGLELLATVDYLINTTNSYSPAVIQNEIKNWSQRKTLLFPINHINIAIRHLMFYKIQLYPNLHNYSSLNG